jgi:acetyltransferase-like isoleucine patch superfamily enzyme
MNAAPVSQVASTRLSETPLVHPTAEVVGGSIGRYTEIAERCVVLETTLGDYSYMMQDSQTWAARIGKFVNIASYTRINAPNHPIWRATLHHFLIAPMTTGRTRLARKACSTGGGRTWWWSDMTSGSAMGRRSCRA